MTNIRKRPKKILVKDADVAAKMNELVAARDKLVVECEGLATKLRDAEALAKCLGSMISHVFDHVGHKGKLAADLNVISRRMIGRDSFKVNEPPKIVLPGDPRFSVAPAERN